MRKLLLNIIETCRGICILIEILFMIAYRKLLGIVYHFRGHKFKPVRDRKFGNRNVCSRCHKSKKFTREEERKSHDECFKKSTDLIFYSNLDLHIKGELSGLEFAYEVIPHISCNKFTYERWIEELRSHESKDIKNLDETFDFVWKRFQRGKTKENYGL